MIAIQSKPLYAPGIYPGQSFAEYLRIDAASAHRLIDLSELSPDHCRWNFENPKKRTADMAIGSASHALIIRPDDFILDFLVAEQCSSCTKAGKQCSRGGSRFDGRAWFCSQHASDDSGPEENPRTILSQGDYAIASDAAGAVLGNADMRSLLDSCPDDDREVTVLWIDPATGLLCKARFDALSRERRIVLDFKSTRCAKPGAFARQAKSLRYDLQAAFYLRAADAAGIDANEFVIAAFEKKAPFGTSINVFSGDDMALASKEIDGHLATYAKCQSSGNWPGYQAGVNIIRLSKWTDQSYLIEE